MEGFFVFLLRDRVGDDTGSDVEMGDFGGVIDQEGADCDVELGFSVGAEIAHGAGVKVSGCAFEFLNDLEGAFLGSAGYGASGETGF